MANADGAAAEGDIERHRDLAHGPDGHGGADPAPRVGVEKYPSLFREDERLPNAHGRQGQGVRRFGQPSARPVSRAGPGPAGSRARCGYRGEDSLTVNVPRPGTPGPDPSPAAEHPSRTDRTRERRGPRRFRRRIPHRTQPPRVVGAGVRAGVGDCRSGASSGRESGRESSASAGRVSGGAGDRRGRAQSGSDPRSLTHHAEPTVPRDGMALQQVPQLALQRAMVRPGPLLEGDDHCIVHVPDGQHSHLRLRFS